MKCMVLVRILIFHCMTLNVNVYVQYLKSKDNKFTDMLLRDQILQFKRETRLDEIAIEKDKTMVPESMWPMEKVWNNN